MKNKAYRLLEDYLEYPWGCMDEIIKLYDQGATSEKIKQAVIDVVEIKVASIGDVFIRSRMYKNKDEFYLYRSTVNADIIAKTDISLGLQLCFDSDPFSNWYRHLYSHEYIYGNILDNTKHEEIEIEELTFEQIHFIPIYERKISELQESIDNAKLWIKQINGE